MSVTDTWQSVFEVVFFGRLSRDVVEKDLGMVIDPTYDDELRTVAERTLVRPGSAGGGRTNLTLSCRTGVPWKGEEHFSFCAFTSGGNWTGLDRERWLQMAEIAAEAMATRPGLYSRSGIHVVQNDLEVAYPPLAGLPKVPERNPYGTVAKLLRNGKRHALTTTAIVTRGPRTWVINLRDGEVSRAISAGRSGDEVLKEALALPEIGTTVSLSGTVPGKPTTDR